MGRRERVAAGVMVRSLHIIGGMEAAAGTSVFCVRLCDALAAGGDDVSLLAGAGDGVRLLEPGHARVHVQHVRTVGSRALRIALPVDGQEILRREMARCRPDVVHLHGLWHPLVSIGARLARHHGVPVVHSIHGMLAPYAFAHHAWRKLIPWHLYQRRQLARARAIHATAELEAEQIRKHGFTQPIAIVPLGVDPPPDDIVRSAGRVRSVLFCGRLHPIKGLDTLLNAWAQKGRNDWRLVLMGPDEDGYRAELQAMVARLAIGGSVEFVGSEFGRAKWQRYHDADLVVLPSRSENFGAVVPEALACGVPVLAGKGTPWRLLEESRCGWWVDHTPEAWRDALRLAMALPDAERRAMGERGRSLVAGKFSWQRIATSMHEVYEWATHRGSMPACVVTRQPDPASVSGGRHAAGRQ